LLVCFLFEDFFEIIDWIFNLEVEEACFVVHL